MLVVLGVVAAVKGPGAFAKGAVQVARLAGLLGVAHHHHVGFDEGFAKSRGLAHKAVNGLFVVLAEHGGHRVVLGREGEERKVVVLFAQAALLRLHVDVGVLVLVRVAHELEVLKGQAAVEIELGLGRRVGRVAVVHGFYQVHAQAGQGNVVAVGGRAHGKQEAATRHKFLHFHGHRGFHLAHLGKAVALGGGFGVAHLLLVPGVAAVGGVELAVLAREIFVVQVQPVVLGELAGQHLVVVNLGVGNFRVGQHHGHGIVPGLFAFGGVHRNFGHFLQLHHVHVGVGVGYLLQDSGVLRLADDLEGDAAHGQLVFSPGRAFKGERAAPVIKQPIDGHLPLKQPKSHPVGLKALFLGIIHWDKHVVGTGRQGQSQQRKQQETLEKHGVLRERAAPGQRGCGARGSS